MIPVPWTATNKPPLGSLINWAHPHARGLVASLILNSGSGSLAPDSTPNQLGASVLGNASWVYTPKGPGINFPGASGDRLSIPDHPLLDITGAISIELLLATSDGNAGIVGRDDFDGSLTYYFTGTNYKVYSLGMLSNSIYWQIGNGTASAGVCSGSATSLLDGKWHHLIATWDGTTATNGMKLYLDGRVWIQATSAISSIKAGSKDLDIGGGGSNWPMVGQIALVNLYSRYIDPAEAAVRAASPWAMFSAPWSPTWIAAMGGAVNYDVSLADSLSGSDVLAAKAEYYAAIADSLGAADVPALTAQLKLSVADSLAASDALVAVAGFVAALADHCGMSDVPSVTAGYNVSLAEGLNLMDAALLAAALNVSLGETLTGADALAVTAGFAALLSDQVNLSDLQTNVAAFSVVIQDNMSLADVLRLLTEGNIVPLLARLPMHLGPRLTHL